MARSPPPSRSHPSSPEPRRNEENAELAVDLYYEISVNRHISLVPDLQSIHHPGRLQSQRDAAVLSPRLSISF
jgi:carbohydrate-selective porin OprB